MIGDGIDWLFTYVSAVDPWARILVAAIFMMLETTLLVGMLVPGDTVVIVAATGVSSPADFVFLFLAVVVGALVGESFGYWLGKTFGPRLRRVRLIRRISEDRWTQIEAFLHHRGGIAVAVSRFLPIAHALTPVIAGAGGMRFNPFFHWTAGASIVWTAIYVTLGTVAKEGFYAMEGRVKGAEYILIGGVVTVLLLVSLTKRLVARRAMRELDKMPDTQEYAADEAANEAADRHVNRNADQAADQAGQPRESASDPRT